MPMTDRLLRVDQVAEILGLRPATIRKLIWLRRIPVVRPTRRAVRIKESDVERIVRLGYRPLQGERHLEGSKR